MQLFQLQMELHSLQMTNVVTYKFLLAVCCMINVMMMVVDALFVKLGAFVIEGMQALLVPRASPVGKSISSASGTSCWDLICCLLKNKQHNGSWQGIPHVGLNDLLPIIDYMIIEVKHNDGLTGTCELIYML